MGEGPGTFELSRMGDRLVLRGPEDHVRNQYSSEGDIPRSLWLHARQRALLALQPESGQDFEPNQSLQVQIVPASSQKTECGTRALAEWAQSPPNAEQVIPLCAAWQIKVKLDNASPKPAEQGDLGELEWKLSPADKAKTTIDFAFTVEHPASMTVNGLP